MSDSAPDWAKAEIAEAIRILKEDGLHIHKTYKSFMDSQQETTPETEDTEGKPPPAKDKPTEIAKKKGVWWSDRGE